MGSVTYKIIQLSSCPVLVVRDEKSLPQGHEGAPPGSGQAPGVTASRALVLVSGGA